MPRQIKRALQNLERYGELYIKEYVGHWKKLHSDYTTDWFKAFDFFLQHAFYRGRRDKLSDEYYENCRNALLEYFGKTTSEQDRKFSYIWQQNIIPQQKPVKNWANFDFNKNELYIFLKCYKAGNTEDRKMVLDALRFLKGCPNKNIVKYALDKLENHQTEDLSQHLKTIHQVGDKVAAFFLRDIILCYDLEPLSDDIVAFQPVDTWVRQVVEELEIAEEDASDSEKIQKLVDACLAAKVNPVKVNAGAWYLGINAFEILIPLLSKKEFASFLQKV